MIIFRFFFFFKFPFTFSNYLNVGVYGGDDSNPNEQITINDPVNLNFDNSDCCEREFCVYIIAVQSAQFLQGGSQKFGLVITTTGKITEPSSIRDTSASSSVTDDHEVTNDYSDDQNKLRLHLTTDTWQSLFQQDVKLSPVSKTERHAPSDDDFFSSDDDVDDDYNWGQNDDPGNDDAVADDGDDVDSPGIDDDIDDTTDDWRIFRRLTSPMRGIFWSDDQSLDDGLNGDDLLSGDDDSYKVRTQDDWGEQPKSNYYYYSDEKAGDDTTADDTNVDDDRDDDWHLLSPNPASETEQTVTMKRQFRLSGPASSQHKRGTPQRTLIGTFYQAGSLKTILLHLKSYNTPLRSLAFVVTDPTGKKLQVTFNMEDYILCKLCFRRFIVLLISFTFIL